MFTSATVCVISVSQALITTPDGRPKRKFGYVGFFVSVFGSVFFSKPPHPTSLQIYFMQVLKSQ